MPASHGYSFSAVVAGEDGTLQLRVWPRRWSDKNARFVADTDNTPEAFPYAEHPLPNLQSAAATLTPSHPKPGP